MAAALLGAVLPACGGGPAGPSFPAGSPRVASTEPAANAVGAQGDGEMVVRFLDPVDPSSLDPARIHVTGRWTGVVSSDVTFDSASNALRIVPDRPFSSGDEVTVVVATDAVRGTNGVGIEPGYAWSFWERSGPGVVLQTEVGSVDVRRPGEAPIESYGAYAGDLDGDGDTDLVVPNERSNDLRIFLNDGTGGYGPFQIVPIPGGSVPSPNEGADFDGDGKLDFAVGNIGAAHVSVFLGDGAGGLHHDADLPTGLGNRGLCVLDLQNDGRPDIVAASTGQGPTHIPEWQAPPNPPPGDRVFAFSNQGGGSFAPSGSWDVGDQEGACAVGDFNEDGRMDVVVGTRTDYRVAVLLSDGAGGFDESWDSGPNGADAQVWKLATGDLDGDGHVDVAIAGGLSDRLVILRGDGTGALHHAATYAVPSYVLSVSLGDLDGDGDLDAVTSQYSTSDFAVWQNRGDGSLQEVGRLGAVEAGACSVLHDRDGDGDLDITGIDEDADVLIFFQG